MIIDKEVKNTWNSKNKEYYLNKGYIFTKMYDEIFIDIKDLPHHSQKSILVECDYCHKRKNINYSDYIKITKKLTEKYFCHVCTYKIKTIPKNLSKYGCENPSQSNEIKQKKKDTCFKNYGCEYTFQSEEIKNIIKKTNIIKYGCENPSQSNKIKQKKKDTCFKNYGCDFPQQNLDIHKKQIKSGYKIKIFEDLYYQGTYEYDFIKNFYNKIKIKNYHSIKFIYQNKIKYYHPDFYLPEYNTIIEIKSEYFFNLHLELNVEKKKSCIEQGYNFIFIKDKNYNEFLSFIKL